MVISLLDYVVHSFENREKEVLKLIEKYQVSYEEIGIFGSYARKDYKATSDLDFCIITENKPDRYISGMLRSDAEDLKADIVYVTKEYFETSTTPFAQNLRRDYRRLV